MLPTYACNDSLIEIMADIRQGVKYVLQTSSQYTFGVSGAAHAAMECALVNTLESGEIALVTVHGVWGERASEIADRQDVIVKQLRKDLGKVFTLEELKQGLEEHRPAVLFMTHGESTGGTLQPLDGIGKLCHEYDCLLVVDTLATVGAVPFFMDKWEVDVAICGAHKCLGGPVGVSPIAFSSRAWKKVVARKSKVRSFYLDARLLAQCWGVEEPIKYHHTCLPINIYGFREALAMIVEEGLEAVWARHEKNSELLWSGLEKLGLHLYVPKEYRLPTISMVCVPEGVNWRAVVDYVREK
jgi:alanine-glyoxylate transaminase/serine-glyoxylate transaminase/serine-pyruvate transaminase